MLKGSRLIRGVCSRIKNGQINAEAAVQTEIAAIADVFDAMDDVYISARIEDIRSVGARILRNLQSEAKEKTFICRKTPSLSQMTSARRIRLC